jgi:hypothetical protein
MASPEDDFAAVADALLAEPGTESGTGFGKSPGVKVDGKIAAMLVKGRLVVKLPADRCAELTAGAGADFLTVGKRTMSEWVAVDPGAGDWVELGREALAFVRG